METSRKLKEKLHPVFFLYLPYFCFFLISSLLYFALHPRIGITDIDAVAYIEGAYSLQDSGKYQLINGVSANHWPPGYSFILASFPDPIQAATALNGLSFGLATLLLYLLAKNSGWKWYLSLSYSLVFGFGFFRLLAHHAKPDILTYALFLLAANFYSSPKHHLHLTSYWIWNVLIPLKLIALVFTPAAILAIYLSKRHEKYPSRISLTLIVLGWGSAIVSIMIFNYITTKSLVSSSHEETTIHSLILQIKQFFPSIARSFLSTWYGSIRDYSIMVPYMLTLMVGIGSISILKLEITQPFFFRLGLLIFFSSWLLLFVRNFDMSPRLTAYGVLLMIVSFKPSDKWEVLWILYALMTIILAISNSYTSNSIGIADPRYKKLSEDSLKIINVIPDDIPIYTNGYHILDVNERISTLQISNIDDLEEGDFFLWFSIENFDAIMQPIIQIERPSMGWCEIASSEKAVLFQKCLLANEVN